MKLKLAKGLKVASGTKVEYRLSGEVFTIKWAFGKVRLMNEKHDFLIDPTNKLYLSLLTPTKEV